MENTEIPTFNTVYLRVGIYLNRTWTHQNSTRSSTRRLQIGTTCGRAFTNAAKTDQQALVYNFGKNLIRPQALEKLLLQIFTSVLAKAIFQGIFTK